MMGLARLSLTHKRTIKVILRRAGADMCLTLARWHKAIYQFCSLCNFYTRRPPSFRCARNVEERIFEGPYTGNHFPLQKRMQLHTKCTSNTKGCIYILTYECSRTQLDLQNHLLRWFHYLFVLLSYGGNWTKTFSSTKGPSIISRYLTYMWTSKSLSTAILPSIGTNRRLRMKEQKKTTEKNTQRKVRDLYINTWWVVNLNLPSIKAILCSPCAFVCGDCMTLEC